MLTEREKWLMLWAFQQGCAKGHYDTVEGMYNAACEHEAEYLDDLLSDMAADAVTVEMVLAHDAPADDDTFGTYGRWNDLTDAQKDEAIRKATETV